MSPVFAFRWSYYGETSRRPEFAARLRVNTVSDDPKLGGRAGIAAIDLSTGEFLLETTAGDGLAEGLGRLAPAEVVVPGELEPPLPAEVLRTRREPWEFDADLAREEVSRRFHLASLDGLGINADDLPAVGAAGALLRYLTDLQPAGLPQLQRPVVRRSDRLRWVDDMTRRNLRTLR